MIVYHSPFSKAEILRILPHAAKVFPERDFLYREFSDGSFWLGIEKGDHNGYWYTATISEDADGCTIEGDIEYDPEGKLSDDKKETLFQKICSVAWAVICCVVFFIPLVIFAMIYAIYFFISKRNEKPKEEYLDIFMERYLHAEKIEQKDAAAVS